MHEIDGKCGSHGLDMLEDINIIHSDFLCIRWQRWQRMSSVTNNYTTLKTRQTPSFINSCDHNYMYFSSFVPRLNSQKFRKSEILFCFFEILILFFWYQERYLGLCRPCCTAGD